MFVLLLAICVAGSGNFGSTLWAAEKPAVSGDVGDVGDVDSVDSISQVVERSVVSKHDDSRSALKAIDLVNAADYYKQAFSQLTQQPEQ
ncbi:MAG: hypothetical protein HRU15_06430, partial [Planctomycetes bacterium]|nr:hypothetical protein [Planctomycetota bacterium]